MFTIIGLDKYNNELEAVLAQFRVQPDLECEIRLGALHDSRFSTSNVMPKLLYETLTKERVKFATTNYTVKLYESGARSIDGSMQLKTKLATVDIDTLPVALRLGLARESDIVINASDRETGRRDIERKTAILECGKNKKYELSISHVATTRQIVTYGWEIEIEYKYCPDSIPDLMHPVQYILQRYIADQVNTVTRPVVDDVLQMYNNVFRDAKRDGLLRKVAYKPVNFKREDAVIVSKMEYAVSNKLDGTRYVAVFNAKTVYIINEKSAMFLGEHSSKDTDQFLEGEWDPVNRTFNVYDIVSNNSDTYAERIEKATHVVSQARNKYITMKRVFFGNVARSLTKCITYMRSTYGKTMYEKRNDGVIFTPVAAPYKSRDARILKYKFSSTVDLQLKFDSLPGPVRAYAAGHNNLVPVQRVRVIVSEEWQNWLTSGTIAEIEKLDSGYGIHRLRPDKTNPNYISVVDDTLDDMENPISIRELQQLIKSAAFKSGGGGAIADSHSQIIPEKFDDELAKKYIQVDRDRFRPLYEIVIAYAIANNMKFSNPECDVNLPVSVVTLYSEFALRDANNIANTLYEENPIVFMKTVIPHEEFEISVLGRRIVRVLEYPKFAIRNGRTAELFTSHSGKMLDHDIQLVDPEIELIEIYHTLYMPFPDKWADYLTLETTLYNIMDTPTRTSGGNAKQTVDVSHIREMVYRELQTFDNECILVGRWAYNELRRVGGGGESSSSSDDDVEGGGGSSSSSSSDDDVNIRKSPFVLFGGKKRKLSRYPMEKIQIISKWENDTILEKLDNTVRDITPLRFSYKDETLNIPHDLHLRKTTFYVTTRDMKIPILDVYNSTSYELVPYVLAGPEKIKVGNPFVLCRFLLIDLWILRVLNKGGYVDDITYTRKSALIKHEIRDLRTKYDDVFGDQYEGVYRDFAIERRKALKREEKFYPYKPLDYFKKNGELRQMS